MISEIVYDGLAGFEGFKDTFGFYAIKNLERINLFVGENNSGKSRFLRKVCATNDVALNFDGINLNFINEQIDIFHQDIKQIFSYRADNIQKIPQQILDITKQKNSQVGKRKLLNDVWEKIEACRNLSLNTVPLKAGSDRAWMQNEFNNASFRLSDSIKREVQSIPYFEGEVIYIPMLRGLRPLTSDKGTTDYYEQRTRLDYFKGARSEGRTIYTGQSLYNDLTNLLLGDTQDREKVRAFEAFLSEAFFQKRELNLIPKVKDDVLHVKIGNDERPVHDLGDGIQALIILLYPLFFNVEKQLLVFIEEPEHSLHPGFQRLFLEALHRKEFNNFQFFITTHSNHFLDITEERGQEISVYTFEKRNNSKGEAQFVIGNVSSRDMRSLELLGVRSSSVFLSNCTIWVEGITDRLYISHFLETYQKYLLAEKKLAQKYHEDIHYSFIEYSGANLTHWSFEADNEVDRIRALSISKKIFLIADADDTNEKPDSEKAQRLLRIGKILGHNFYKHKSREIENVLHENVILKTIADLEKKSVDEIRPTKFTQDLYSSEKIGSYVQKNFKGLSRKYEGESGSMNDKKGFCKRTISHINTFDDLSEEAQDLCKKILSFIGASNLKQ